MTDNPSPLMYRCNVCGEEWPEANDSTCPFCGSDDTFLVDDEDEATP